MHAVVVGLGKTGASCLRYFAKHGVPVSATDNRRAPPGLLELGALAQSIDVRLGGFDLSLLDGASQVVMSPGVSLNEPIAVAARERGIEVLGDVELFARDVRSRGTHTPVIGITGTNGKSTVTTLVAHMAKAAGRAVLAGGNLGEPALDLLEQPTPDLYVLELSSFQLETTTSLTLQAAVVLNVTADHLDRYASVAEYANAKARIYSGSRTLVLNADDPWVMAMHQGTGAQAVTFSIERDDADYSLLREDGRLQLARSGKLVRWLLENQLVDELNLLIVPVVVGEGTRLFPDSGQDIALDLIDSRAFPKGTTLQVYRPTGRQQYAAATAD